MKQYDIYKAGGVIIRDRKLLVVRAYGKDIFIAPGGKKEADESIVDALKRELHEEVSISITDDHVELLDSFYAKAAGNEDTTIRMDVFIVHAQELPVASSEIEEMRWVDSRTRNISIGSIFEHDVIPLLKQRDMID